MSACVCKTKLTKKEECYGCKKDFDVELSHHEKQMMCEVHKNDPMPQICGVVYKLCPECDSKFIIQHSLGFMPPTLVSKQ